MIGFDETGLRRIGERVVAMIVERTLRGIDAEGRPMQPYSTRTFAMPAGALWAPGSRTAARRLRQQGALRYFQRGGSLWVAIQGGYRTYKEARFPGQGSEVNLTLTGSMMRSLSVREVRADTRRAEIVIGFLRSEEAEKAYWHEVTGAGRSRVRRRFMGLTPDQLRALEREFLDAIRIRAV
ncbi:MAG: hypothetical protein KatS3mg051_1567 [Anaerolineae bacterium]|nr:MAG: hypothetical protein KatS3mg051_1567 [Anaerolineae bacterium]